MARAEFVKLWLWSILSYYASIHHKNMR